METAMLVVEAGASNPSLVTYSQPGAHSASRCVGRRYVCLSAPIPIHPRPSPVALLVPQALHRIGQRRFNRLITHCQQRNPKSRQARN